ncbi:hypothetical protein Bca52824_009764 [Brassica carinata]|uniref:Uncharacterized protein n=1 Tax=Brassica carinata TaxID=52824 RepID=A0A8X7WBV5_BRACI|nr:hypothetical protein Bca52824_009764 [Brassica carinata]
MEMDSIPPHPANYELVPPSANEQALLLPLADQAFAKLIQADTHANDASILITIVDIDGLDVDADDTEFELNSEFNLDHLTLPTGDVWYHGDGFNTTSY